MQSSNIPFHYREGVKSVHNSDVVLWRILVLKLNY